LLPQIRKSELSQGQVQLLVQLAQLDLLDLLVAQLVLLVPPDHKAQQALEALRERLAVVSLVRLDPVVQQALLAQLAQLALVLQVPADQLVQLAPLEPQGRPVQLVQQVQLEPQGLELLVRLVLQALKAQQGHQVDPPELRVQ
jgi:hypothetical protein